MVAGYLFWWTEDEDQNTDDQKKLINRQDPLATDHKTLIQSRKKVLKIANWIIPGHGKTFQNSHFS